MSAVLPSSPERSPRAIAIEWLPVLLGLLALYVPTFYGFATTIWQEDEHAYGPIILAVIIWLFWDQRHVLLTSSPDTAPRSGIALLLCGLFSYLVGRSLDINVLQVGALPLILAGVMLAMRGTAALKAMWFTLLFTVFLVPFPNVFIDAVTGPLKQNVSAVAEYILYAAGYPVARSGVVITIGHYELLVADACSGINSMFSLVAVGLLYLYIVRRKSWIHNGLIVASLLPIAFCANTARVIFLVLITYHFGDAAGQGFIHGFSGMVLFIIALISVIILDAVLVRILKSATGTGVGNG